MSGTFSRKFRIIDEHDISIEEYKTLRNEILQYLQNYQDIRNPICQDNRLVKKI